MNGLRVAIIFLTGLPLAVKEKVSDKDWSRSLRFFSLVGFIFSIVSLIIILLIDEYAWEDKSMLFAMMIVLSHIFMNLGLHMDGLMDAFDGVAASRKNAKETHDVIKDSRVGAFGAMAGILLVIAKIVSLAHVSFYHLIPVVVLTPMISRAMAVYVLAFLPTRSSSSKISTSFHKHVKKPQDFLYNLIPIAIAALFLWHEIAMDFTSFILVFVLAVVVGSLIYKWLGDKLFGHCGDTYGAGIEIVETLAYFLAALLIY